MKHLTAFALAVALHYGCAWATVAQSQGKPGNKPLTATVSGRVTIKGKGVPGVTVGLRSNEFGSQTRTFKNTTDAEGNYQISDIPGGNYQIFPIVPALVVSAVTPFGARKILVINEGENIDSIDFALVPGAVMTGKVTDAEGRPIIEQPLTLYPAEATNRQTGMYAVNLGSNFQTDDRGIYRMYGVPAGRYKLAVGQNAFAPGQRSSGPTYSQTFYPDVTDIAKAGVIELSEGGEASNIDITVGRPLQNFTASGRVVDAATDEPVGNLVLLLETILSDGRAFYSGNELKCNSRGEFHTSNLTPGKYSVALAPQQNEDTPVAKELTFEIFDQDVTGLIIRTSTGGSVAGTVVLDGPSDKNILAAMSQLRLTAVVRQERAAVNFAHSATINPDGSFRIGGLGQGIASFSLGTQFRYPIAKGFIIARVEREGIVQPAGIDIKPGEQIARVRIVIAYGRGSIRGTVKLENGELPPNARSSIRVTKLGEPLPIMRPPQVDARGRFLIEGLPAGNYELETSVYEPTKRPSISRQQVSVTDGVVSEVTITIPTNPNPGPVTNP